jgi:ribosomal protein S18 acetylase RimI-like enzyme
MPGTDHQGLRRQPHLTDDERNEIATLAATCNAHDGLDLKLAIGPPHPEADQAAGDFLFYADRRLVGYCSLDSSNGPPFELCGMVHPDYRRRGIGRALLQAASAESTQRGLTHVLLICEDASVSGRGFVTTVGAVYRFSEYRLELDREAWDQRPSVPNKLTLRPAGRPDLETLVHILAAAFDDPAEEVRATLALGLADPGEHYYLAYLDDTPIGSIRYFFYHDGTGANLHNFAVLPAYRGLGLGRELLSRTIETLLAAHHGRIGLEVQTENRHALGLYLTCGFREVTTYGYYHLELA